MDIHKPKAWHGWPEFLKEIGTIVIGVLIALGAEAVAQNLHEQHLSAEARAAIRAEINLDVANLKRRVLDQPCIDRRMADLGEFISKAEAGRPFPRPLGGEPDFHFAYTERWDSATAGGRASLFSSDEQRDFARVYENFKKANEYQAVEMAAWGQLEGLEGVEHPSSDLLARARTALGSARMADSRMRIVLSQAQARAAEIGIKGEGSGLIVPKPSGPDPFCQPMSAAPAALRN